MIRHSVEVEIGATLRWLYCFLGQPQESLECSQRERKLTLMKDRIREMLSWYASENPGVRTNLARMLNHGRLGGTGKMVILPVDQGFEHGPARSFAPNPAGYDPRYHFELAIEAGCNAFAAPLGLLEAGVSDYCGDIPLILKCSNHDVLYEERDPLTAITSWVDDALRLAVSPWASPFTQAQLSVPGCMRSCANSPVKPGQLAWPWSSGRIPAAAA